jgi:hypothetical protein
MIVKDAHARIKANIWQAIARSKLDITDIPQEQLDSIVNIAAEAALEDLDDLLYQSLEEEEKVASEEVAGMDDVDNEEILWKGRPFLSITRRYVITDDRVRIFEGLIGRTYQDIELIRIQDVTQKQSVSERLLNIGDVTISSHEETSPVFKLENVRNSPEVYEILRKAVLNARKRHNFSYREEM